MLVSLPLVWQNAAVSCRGCFGGERGGWTPFEQSVPKNQKVWQSSTGHKGRWLYEGKKPTVTVSGMSASEFGINGLYSQKTSCNRLGQKAGKWHSHDTETGLWLDAVDLFKVLLWGRRCRLLSRFNCQPCRPTRKQKGIFFVVVVGCFCFFIYTYFLLTVGHSDSWNDEIVSFTSILL